MPISLDSFQRTLDTSNVQGLVKLSNDGADVKAVGSGFFARHFGAYTKLELLSRTEEKIKNDIMEQINEQMSLGQISGIYFTDYIFIE